MAVTLKIPIDGGDVINRKKIIFYQFYKDSIKPQKIKEIYEAFLLEMTEGFFPRCFYDFQINRLIQWSRY